MAVIEKDLTFADVDELCFAAQNTFLAADSLSVAYTPRTLCPLLELLFHVQCGDLPSWIIRSSLRPSGATNLIQAITDRRDNWLSSDKRMGVSRLVAHVSDFDNHSKFDAFLMAAKRAALDTAKAPGNTPGHLTAGIRELRDNIREHSEAGDTGILAFRAAAGIFEIVAADSGIGLLNSLRKCDEYSSLLDHGDALKTALQDGASRHGKEQSRGYGFREVFNGLAHLNGSLRFRTGDHALTMDGTSPNLSISQLSQKPMVKGFIACVQCFTPKP